MPDFERLTDSFRVFAAKDEASREWARGYQAGKTRARYELFCIVVFIVFVALVFGFFYE